MAQACASIVFGVNLNDELIEAVLKNCEEEGMILDEVQYDWQKRDFAAQCLQEYGFAKGYSANGGTPCWFGISLEDIWEGNDTSLTGLKITPTGEDHVAYSKEFNALPDWIKAVCPSPDVLIIWSTS